MPDNLKKFPNTEYLYFEPKDCTHPKRLVQKVDVEREVTKNGANDSFTIARLYTNDKNCLGIRWNIASDQFKDKRCEKGELRCLGFPYSHAHPTWFILPQGAKIEDNKLIIPLPPKKE